MVLQAELISKSNHSLIPGLISIFREGMGPFKIDHTYKVKNIKIKMVFWDRNMYKKCYLFYRIIISLKTSDVTVKWCP